jgi:Holliday junction resolvasome RuvABC DNA-binding subunit
MLRMVLSKLPGVGERLAQKITEHFGGEEEAIASLKSGDIARIAEIDGVSPKRALSLARMIAGQSGSFSPRKKQRNFTVRCCKTLSPSHRVPPPVKECNS